MLTRFIIKNGDYFYAIFRILVGLLFMQHGIQKLFGLLGAQQFSSLFTLMGAAGVIEFFGGLFIVLGLFTRLVALVAGLEMLVAYLMVHFPQGLVPILNGGELAPLYFICFLVLFSFGARKWSLERLILKKEVF